jgi:MFS family permease
MAKTTVRPFRPTGKIEAVRIIVLGANLWAIALLFPVMHAGISHLQNGLVSALPLVPLLAGAWVLGSLRDRSPRRRQLAVSMLIVFFPISLAALRAARDDIAEHDAQIALHSFATALSLLVYAAVALEACTRPFELRASHAQSLPSASPGKEPRGRVWIRRILLCGVVLGGLLVSVLAPTQSSRAELERTWSASADEAAVFASIVGAIASAAAIAGIIGPHLRAPRPSEVPTVSRQRTHVTISLLLALLSLSGFIALRTFEP